MDVSERDKVAKEICDLKHESVEDKFHRQDDTNKVIWTAIEEITQPSTGHLAVLKSDLEARVEKLESRINGLIMTIITTVLGTIVAIGGEFLKKLIG